jgi:hypothetical protein
MEPTHLLLQTSGLSIAFPGSFLLISSAKLTGYILEFPPLIAFSFHHSKVFRPRSPIANGTPQTFSIGIGRRNGAVRYPIDWFVLPFSQWNQLTSFSQLPAF